MVLIYSAVIALCMPPQGRARARETGESCAFGVFPGEISARAPGPGTAAECWRKKRETRVKCAPAGLTWHVTREQEVGGGGSCGTQIKEQRGCEEFLLDASLSSWDQVEERSQKPCAAAPGVWWAGRIQGVFPDLWAAVTRTGGAALATRAQRPGHTAGTQTAALHQSPAGGPLACRPPLQVG